MAVYTDEQLKRFSLLLREEIYKKEITQTELAKKTDLGSWNINKIATGNASPTRKTLLLIREVLGKEWLKRSYKILLPEVYE